MKKRVLTYSLIILIALIFTLSFIFLILKSPSISEIEDKTVLNVIDGDTFEYYDKDSNTIKTIRLLCVDTPEEGEEGYEEAKNFLESLILGEQVILEKDMSETDKYGRLLRYVYLQDGTFVNELIIKNGYGEILRIEPGTSKCDEIELK